MARARIRTTLRQSSSVSLARENEGRQLAPFFAPETKDIPLSENILDLVYNSPVVRSVGLEIGKFLKQPPLLP